PVAGGAAGAPAVTPVFLTGNSPPAVSFTADPPQVAGGLVTLAYTVSVTNKDAAGGPVSTFALSVKPATNWVSSLSVASLSLAPGATGTATVSITAPSGISSGNYTFTVTAAAAGHPSTSATGTYTFDTTAPSAVTVYTPKTKGRSQVQLSWSSATDSGSGVASYRVYRSVNGAAYYQCASVTTTGYTDNLNVSGTIQYYVKAVDKVGNISSASNVVTVSIAGKGAK
ncbi:MAG: hypothetical protein HY706_14350, partial [Candidatus Hydrogenedentes bacterium]|nr:hypothetical protein [Candidatus Hydrogenedentota bacterium]